MKITCQAVVLNEGTMETHLLDMTVIITKAINTLIHVELQGVRKRR